MTIQTTNRIIAEFLRSIRKHLKLSQEKISRWENKRKLEPESRLESEKKTLAEKVLGTLKNGPLSASEIAENLGHKCISGGLKKTLRKLLDSGKIELTIPDKKGSRLQKYLLKTTTTNHLAKL